MCISRLSDLEAAYDRAVAAGCQWIEGKIQAVAWGERSFYVEGSIWESDLSGG